mgnify:CR=1 FL=1
MRQKPVIPQTNQERLAWAAAGAARHNYDASLPRLESLFADGSLVFTPRGVWTRRPATTELSRLAELLTRAGVTSLAIDDETTPATMPP